MAYAKLFKVIVNGALGFQTLNQAALNNDEMRTQMYVEHGEEEVAKTVPYNFHELGRHDLPEIARSVLTTMLVIQPNLSVSVAMGLSGPGITIVWKLATGVYFLGVTGLSTWWCGGATCLAGASLTYLPPIVRPVYASSTTGGTSGIFVSTFKLDTGDFVPVDSAFTLALYGTP